jgi:hypothetical protein
MAAILTIASLIAACSTAAPIASTAPSPSDPPATSLAPSASPEPSVAVAPSADPATPAPSRRPRPSLDVDPAELDAYLTSSISLLNLADADLSVVVAYVDAGSGVLFPLDAFELASMDQADNDAPPGTYRLEFRQPAGATAATTCTIQVADAERYIFAALGDAIAITSSAAPPNATSDLFVATSPLCLD